MTIITPPYAGSIMAYVGADTPVGYGAFGALGYVDFANAVMVQHCNAAITGVRGLKKFETDVPGDETLQATEAAILGSNTFAGTLGCIHPGGDIFLPVGILSNQEAIGKVRVSDFSLLETIGTPGSGFGSTWDPVSGAVTRLACSFQSIPLQRGGANFFVSRGIRGGGIENEVVVLNVSNPSALMLYAVLIAEDVARLCPGRSAENLPVSSFYCAGTLSNYFSGSATPFTLYEFKVYGNALLDYSTVNLPTNAAVSRRQIRTVAPADIDATWSTFATVANPGYDTADGNILVLVSTLDAVTNTCYLAKFNATTGAFMWACPITGGIARIPLDLATSNFNGTLEYFDVGAHGVVRINLADGSVTSTTAWNNGLPAMNSQIYDYLTASITGIISGAYGQSTGPVPTYLGDYLAAHSNTIPGNRFARLFTGASYDDGNGGGGGGGISDTARSQAWSFTRDGHTFYVLNLGTAEGTFVYDVTTNQWAQFDTAGYDQWNMRNGCMWGDRIVAGSSTGLQVWELDPEAVTDEGSLAMNHAVTGTIPRRSRDYVSCDAVRVSASVGFIDTVTGAAFNLRFSDDNGRTWSDYYAVTLTDASYSDEIAWRSLGSFAAPGRVFEFTDSGGLIRIDGADMNPEQPEPAQ